MKGTMWTSFDMFFLARYRIAWYLSEESQEDSIDE